jgi:hypothetical protein
MDSSETGMAPASFSRNYGRRIDERCVQHLFRTGIPSNTKTLNKVKLSYNIHIPWNWQTEAPLLIKPFLSKMTKSEIHAVFTAGFATIAG